MKTELLLLGSACAVIGIVASFVPQTAKAVPLNGGFEAGDLSGWHVYAPLYPVWQDPPGGYQAIGDAYVVHNAAAAEGQYYAAIANGNPYLEVPGDKEVALRRTIHLHAGQTIYGWVSYSSMDLIDDDADLSVGGTSVWNVHLQSDTSPYYYLYNVGGPSHWDYWSWTATSNGFYEINLSVLCQLDGELTSIAFLDGVSMSDIPDCGWTFAYLVAVCFTSTVLKFVRKVEVGR